MLEEPKLTIELVPKTCWFSNVRAVLSRREWQGLKRAVFSSAGHRCQICNGQGPKWPVECHEVWQYDDHERIQTLSRLIALCPSCHQVKHIGLAKTLRRDQKALKHLARVNGWTKSQADRYVSDQFSQWEERSRHEWRLDIDHLRTYGFNPKTLLKRRSIHERMRIHREPRRRPRKHLHR
jgi:5-methylcytosine-specific restriction endonuclease McrA